MKAFIAKNVLGVFAFDEKGKLIDHELFPKKAEKIAERLKRAEGQLLEEEKRLLERLGDYEVIFEKEKEIPGIKIENPNMGGEILRANLENVGEELGFSAGEVRDLSYQVGILLAKDKVKEASKEKDRIVIQAIEALDDCDEALNLLSERIREWYSLHFPELDRIDDHKRYVELISQFGSRDAKGSMGAEIDEGDVAILKNFAGHIYALYKFREDLEGYIGSAMGEIAPNTSALVGPLLGARLISLANGLLNLAKMPGGRIQVIGAEKALFSHIKQHTPPPKHGAIFQHPLIKTSPWWHRGKIARTLAGKIAIAARVDAFSGEYIGGELKEDFLKRVEAIKQEHPNEPKKMRIIRYKPEERKKGKPKRKKRGYRK